MAEIAVIGAGAWGTALSMALARKNNRQVRLWAYEKEVVASIRERRVNELFLPGVELPPGVTVTQSLEEAIAGADIVLSVMPSHHARRVWTQMKPHLKPEMLLVSATKGIENDTLQRMTQVIRDVMSDAGYTPRLCALSGPTFAKEVAAGYPTTITVASENSELSSWVQEVFSDVNFRVYRNDDLVGVELGGSVKNVIAIAAGVVEGIGYGHNTTAALITRGLTEMTRLVVACGGRSETMAGLAGMGDLVLTCTGGLSRNRTVGVELGKGRKLEDIIAGMHGMVAEGVMTTTAALQLAHSVGVEMPITAQMFEVLQKGKSPRDAIRDLMGRPLTQESALYRG